MSGAVLTCPERKGYKTNEAQIFLFSSYICRSEYTKVTKCFTSSFVGLMARTETNEHWRL